jgi:hypothetical protein
MELLGVGTSRGGRSESVATLHYFPGWGSHLASIIFRRADANAFAFLNALRCSNLTANVDL